jgi:hypothetical protein
VITRLTLPYRPPEIDDIDFDVPLPSAQGVGENEAAHYHVHYHIFMARTAAAVYRFRATIRSAFGILETIKAVKTVDEELAEVIDSLPRLLQPETNLEDEELHQLELANPWIKWQRYDVTLVLLHLRLRIHRTMQSHWLSDPDQYNWARSVSVSSAMSVIWINHNWDQPASMRKQWYLRLLHVFLQWLLTALGPYPTIFLSRPFCFCANVKMNRPMRGNIMRQSVPPSACSRRCRIGTPLQITQLRYSELK